MGTEAAQQTDKVVEGQIVAQGLNQLATELRTQRELALSKPRDEERCAAKALAELKIAPEFAAKAFYVIPYKDYSSGEPKTVNVEGPSVKASRAMQRHWGNCATASRIVSEDENRVEVEGIAMDFESNVIMRRTLTVDKFRIDKRTKVKTPLKSDRLVMAINAACSKVERNAMLAILPVYLVERYFSEAKKIAGGKGGVKSVAELYKEMFAGFLRNFAVDKPRLEAYIKAEPSLDGKTDEEIIGHMRGIYNALKDEETTVEKVFGKAEEKKPAGTGPVGAGDLTGNK